MKAPKHLWKRLGAGVLALGVAGGCAFGGMKIYDQYHGGPVQVYGVENLSTTYWGDQTQTEGFVTTDRMQSAYLSDSQTVEEIKVKEGQKVKKGDVLFTYDSTLSDIDLKRKNIELERQKMELEEARKELKTIQSYRPGKPIPGSTTGGGGGGGYKPSKPSKPSKPEKPTWPGLALMGGKGTEKKPYEYLWRDDFQYSNEFLAAAMQGDVEAFVRFYLVDEEPEPLPEPEPDPDEKPEEDPGDSSETGEGSESTDPGDSSEEPGGEGSSQPEEGDSSESGDTSEEPSEGESSEEPSGEVTPTTANVRFMLNLLTALDEDAPSEEPSEETSDQPKDEEKEPEAKKETLSWVMQIQHSLTGYRYVMTSMFVGEKEYPVSTPMEKLDPMEYPEDDTGDLGWDDWGDWGDDGGYVDGIIYTSAEIAEMLREQETTIRDLDLNYRKLLLEVKKLEQEVSDSAVYAQLDGIVTAVNAPEDTEEYLPVVKVSGGGGYLVKGTLSELDLETVQPGMTMTIDNWMTGEQYTGTVSEISEYPSANNGFYWGSGNNNVSYYSFTVNVDGSADLEENSYVEMSYMPSDDGSGSQNIYLMRSFVRSENGQSYVYMDVDGTLEKINVSTGKDLWGSYVEITSHNVPDDAKLAFPYGQKVREKAPTEEGSIDSLYGY